MTKEKAKIITAGGCSIGIMGPNCYTFQVSGATQSLPGAVLPFYTRTRALMPTRVGDFQVIPLGESNNYPEELRMLIDEDNFLPKGLEKNVGLIWGQGPALYKTHFENGKRIKEFVDDAEIQNWLDSWDSTEYLTRATIDYTTINGHFTKFFRNLGYRIGRPGSIASLEHVSCAYARLEWPDEFNQVHHIITGDFRQPWNLKLSGSSLKEFFTLRAYPVFDPSIPLAFPISMRYSNLYNFALDYEYSRAPFHGALNWIRLASSIPKLLANFNANSAAIKYHIESPAEYWEAEKDKLMKKCTDEDIEFKEKMFSDLKDKTFEKIMNALSGIEKVGKVVTTESFFSHESPVGELTGWKITVLDQKVKDFIDAQTSIAREGGFNVSAGVGLHPALSNLSKDGNLPSGSEQLYAFKLYLMTSIDIPEGIILKDINTAIRINFPGKNLKLGFYHEVVMTEEATSPGNRLKNTGPNGPANSNDNKL
jgi:hypothetical protein